MLGRAAKTTLESPTGRRASKSAIRGAFKAGRSRGGKGAAKIGTKAGTRGAGNLLKTGLKLKAGKEATKAGAKSASKAGRGFGKLASKKGKREFRVAEKNLQSGGGGRRLLKFSLLALAGLGIGALVARALGSQDSESSNGDSTSTGSGSSEVEGSNQGHSDPSFGPLIGESHQGDIEGVTESQPEAEQRIKTRIGEDERTSSMPRVNVEVNGGVAELRGAAPSEEAKEAAGEIAAEAEGVSEVRNLIEVESQE